MKHKFSLIMALMFILAMLVASCAAPSPTAEAPEVAPTQPPQPEPTQPAPTQPAAETAECTDENRVPITWSTIAGFYTDAMSQLVADFEATHCIKVNIVGIDNAQLYDKQVIEMVGKTGAYDVVNLETAEKAEFAENGFILPMDDYLAAHPEVDYADVAPILADMTTSYKGKIWGLPYYTYTAGYFYRADLFEDPTEQAAFKEKYGYDLAVPQTWEQHRDIAEFFTRKAGDNLKGEPLTKDFYGVGLMAGRFQEIQDELSAFIWAWGGDWLNDDGTTNVEAITKALKWYVELLPFAPPAALTVTYDGVMNQMQDGQIAQTAGFFLDQWPNAANTENTVPGAKMGVAEAPERRAYIGGFLMAVSAASKHPEEAMAFVAYIGGKEAQRNFALAGGTTTRMSILTDPEITAPENRAKTAHFPVLVQVFESMKDTRSNLFYTPFGAKIYNTLGPMLQAAAAGEKTPEEAVQDLAEQIEKICGGPCPINK
ncbi:MAG: sugar ABC transporter substrate-binding protein [Anaerolineales bacterium]|nr:sugar ABC transporter substrate-binding protein [Anaerolineales bacterium]